MVLKNKLRCVKLDFRCLAVHSWPPREANHLWIQERRDSCDGGWWVEIGAHSKALKTLETPTPSKITNALAELQDKSFVFDTSMSDLITEKRGQKPKSKNDKKVKFTDDKTRRSS